MTIIIEWLNNHPPMLNLSTGQKGYETYFYQSTATPVPATGNVSITTMNHGPNYITNASVNIINGIYYYQLGVCLPTCVHLHVTCVHPYVTCVHPMSHSYVTCVHLHVTPLCHMDPPLCHMSLPLCHMSLTPMSHGPTPMSHVYHCTMQAHKVHTLCNYAKYY